MSLTDNRTQLQDCDATADVASDSTADPQSRTIESGLLIEGGSAIQFQITDANEYIAFDRNSGASTFSLDLSDQTVYIGIKDNLSEVYQSLGGMIVLADVADGGTGDVIGYEAFGSDVVGLPYQKRYHFFKLDVNAAAAAPGTINVDFFQYDGTEGGLDQTAILQVGYGSTHLAKGQGTIPNAWFDGIYHIANDSFAASIAGGTTGTPETMTDLVGDDEAVGAGMFSNPITGTYYLFAPTEWGAAAGATAFAGTDETWVYLGDNGGGREIGATHFPMQLLGGSGTNIFRQTRVTNQNVGQRAQFDMSDASFDEIELDTTTWINFGALTLWAEDTSKFCDNSTFINGDQMDLSSADMDGNAFIGSNDADGIVRWGTIEEDQDKQINTTYVRNGVHNAIEINPTGAGPFTYTVTGLNVDGFASQDDGDAVEAEKVFFINPVTLDADININLSTSSAINIGGGADTGTEGFSFRVVGSYTGTVTITQTVTLSAQVNEPAADGGADIVGASVRFENASTGALLSQGTTDSNGLYSDSSFNYTGDLAVTIKVRTKAFKFFRTAATIISTGLAVGITLTPNDIVDLP